MSIVSASIMYFTSPSWVKIVTYLNVNYVQSGLIKTYVCYSDYNL